MVVLDTDVLIEFSKGNSKTVAKIKELQAVEQLATTVFNAEEFLFGLHSLGKKEKMAQGIELLRRMKIYDYTQKEIDVIVELKTKLKKQGKTIGKYDETIAGICVAKNEVLFTLNKKHFEKVEGLKLI